MALHPVGPLPPTTYWLRRAGLALVLLVVVLLLAKACGGGGSTTAARPTPTPTVAPIPTATPTPTPSPTPSVETTVACPDASLTLSARAEHGSYPAGDRVRLVAVVRNTSKVTCTRDVGGAPVALSLTSGSDRIWSSDDCGSTTGHQVVTLLPGAARTLSVTWSGGRSRPGCPSGLGDADAGTYVVSAKVGTLVDKGRSFRLT